MPTSHVLIIDDDPMITRLLDEHFSNEGYEVTSAHMAEQGFQMATQTAPDLIFLDVMLPDATGFQMLGRLRENPITHAIPIIMMSGTARYPNQKEIGINMGANAYVVKPFNVIELGEKARELIGTPRENKPKMTKRPAAAPLAEAETPWAPSTETKPEIETLAFPVIGTEVTSQKAASSIEFISDEIPLMAQTSESVPESVSESDPETNPEEVSESAPLEVFHPNEAPAHSPREEPREQKSRVAARKAGIRILRGPLLAALFFAHIVMTLMITPAPAIQALSHLLGGWALLLGMVVAACSLLGFQMEAGEALMFLRWPAIPIVARALFTLMGLIPRSAILPPPTFWLRPLDLFEMAAIVIMGISFRRLPGSSTKKTLLASILIAAGWCLTSRGYFLPH